MIRVIDIGCGNVSSVISALDYLGVRASLLESSDDYKEAAGFILPGVGSFGDCVKKLRKSRNFAALENAVVLKKTPFLGICVGMQILGKSSEESSVEGLGWIDGRVKKFVFPTSTAHLPVPHMGWNYVNTRPSYPLDANAMSGQRFYFLHSYYFESQSEDTTQASTSYSLEFASLIGKENIFGVQFHPERSGEQGLMFLKSFVEFCGC